MKNEYKKQNKILAKDFSSKTMPFRNKISHISSLHVEKNAK
jgi:hypothetical protein